MVSPVRVVRCEQCGVRTVEPFVLKDRTLCAMCADRVDPWSVSERERVNRRRFSEGHVPTSRYRD